MTEELIRLKKHLESLEAFLSRPAHKGFVAAREAEIAQIEEALLDNDPVNHVDEIEHYKFRGERRCLKSMLTVFSDAMEELKDRISELEDEEDEVGPRNAGEVAHSHLEQGWADTAQLDTKL
jgi:chromosome segregation ATPase